MNKHYLGNRVSSLELYDDIGPITGVALLLDDNNEIVSGDDTGYVLEIECKYGTQTMADNILAGISGRLYKGFRATGAALPPTAQLGDGVTVGGIYSFLAYRNITFGPGHRGEIAAPGESALIHEYGYQTPDRKLERKIAQTRSLITKSAEQIRLEVEKELEGLSASITVQLDEITTAIVGLDNAVATIEQKVDNITLSVSNKESSSTISLLVDGVTVSSKTIRFTGDVVFESDLAAGNTTVSGDCITTGEVNVDYIKLGGEMVVYRSSGSSRIGGYMGYVTSSDFYGNTTTGMGMLSPDSDYQVVVTTGGARLTSPTAEIVTAKNVTLETDNKVNVHSAEFNSDVELTVTSDRRLKDDIRYDVDRYLDLFDRLIPASFYLIGKEQRRHLGFIAQDVETALSEAHIPLSDFALLHTPEDENDRYGISYGELIAILTAKIQDMDKRLRAVEV